jgi:hypothetical protein
MPKIERKSPSALAAAGALGMTAPKDAIDDATCGMPGRIPGYESAVFSFVSYAGSKQFASKWRLAPSL